MQNGESIGAIRFKCPRCGKRLSVSPEKAGHQGRCPTCGGKILVPRMDTLEHIDEHGEKHTGAVAGIFAGIVILILMVVFALSGGEEDSTGTQPGAGTQRTRDSQQLRRIRAALVQLDDLGDRFKTYQEQSRLERRFRARDVRTRLNNYEPVSVCECILRKEVLAMRDETRTSAPGTGVAQGDDWRLDTPLTGLERANLRLLSEELERRSSDLVQGFRRAGIVINLDLDLRGRRVLDARAVAKEIALRRERLQKEASDLRQQMHGHGAAGR